MSIGFPTNTIVLIVATMIGAGTAFWFSLSLGLRQLPVSQLVRRAWLWGAAVLLIIWLLVRLALSLAYPPGEAALTVPFLLTFVGLGMLAGILPLLLSPTFRQVVRAIPQTWLVGIHAVRLAGFLFLALADMRLLPAEFALPAGYGDMAVGLLALGLVYLLAKQKPYARELVMGWNILGLLDFTVAIATGITEIGPFSAQLAASGVSLLYLGFVFIIPSFGIPLYALLHIYSLYQMLSRRMGERIQSLEESAQTPVFPGEQRPVQIQSK